MTSSGIPIFLQTSLKQCRSPILILPLPFVQNVDEADVSHSKVGLPNALFSSSHAKHEVAVISTAGLCLFSLVCVTSSRGTVW